MKLIHFTTELTPEVKADILGIVGEPREYPKDDRKRVPALKLIKAMKQMTDKKDYIVSGDTRFVEASQKLGFNIEKPAEKEEEKEPEDSNELPEVESELTLSQIAQKLIAMETRYADSKSLVNTLNKEWEKRLASERKKSRAELDKIKRVVKNIIKS